MHWQIKIYILCILTILALKLPPLLANYLLTHKRLDLPGIGSFLLDTTTAPEPETSKQTKNSPTVGISFESDPSIKENPELISFITAQTGKMKALAKADLNSHLELAQQFLNMGKPFVLEGIGSLTKTKTGFAFSMGQLSTEKLKEYSSKELGSSTSGQNSLTDYQSVFYPPKPKARWKKPVIFLLVITGLVLAVGGGYTIYKKSKAAPKLSVPETREVVETKKEDTIAINQPIAEQKDSVRELSQIIQPGNFKFIVEVADKARGLQRFTTLKNYGLPIRMETKDSSNFKLFFLLPASVSDTARIIDSLGALYTPYWAKAFVEN